MKTKSLLMAAATLAATVISSQAQVYSQNIVGYVNVAYAGASGYTLVANPLDDGAGNQLTNVVGNLPNKSQIITWAGSTYNGAIVKGASGWSSSVSLPPGSGFFVKNGVAASPVFTNTFAGSLVVPSGMSVTNVLAAGYNLVGSPIPFAGDATTDTNINLGASLANKSQLISWDSVGQVFNGAVVKGASGWSSAFNASVGQGFFVNNKTATNWVQVAP
jgi:hypothetical protein